jgi:predicted Rossmann fold nucleotide-binding protein DprA/Smf involved in DNA uptake
MHHIFKDNSNYKQYYDNICHNTLNSDNFTDKQIEYILKVKSEFKVTDIKKILDERDVSIITIKDKKYPDYLKQIPNSPYVFYLR